MRRKLELLDWLTIPEEEPPVREEVFLLNRICYGATQRETDRLAAIGWAAYVDEQLNPVSGKEKELEDRLASFTLNIKYAENKDKYPGCDENRPLNFINAKLEDLWPLANYKVPMANQERVRPADEVRMASWVRAVYSPWQLREIMTEFWHNHFNVNAFGETKISATFPLYDRDVIRKNCFGNFRTFLEDVAKSTAMQYFLDNFSSKASPANENYARELFELHTLGSDFYYNNLYNRWREVPGALDGKPKGYIDEDVYEAARSFTGWTIADGSGIGRNENLPNTGNFYYFDGWHDNYQKRVLGNDFDPNQPPLADGLKVLDLVASHPATARNICTKLCRRFIADAPPESIIAGAAAVFLKNLKNPHQIRETLRYILSSAEYRNTTEKKVKRPFELMVSALRLAGADFTPNGSLTGMLSQMGYFHFQWPSPTGHPDKSTYWLSSNTMLVRWNTAYNLLANPGNKLTRNNFKSLMPESIKTPLQIAGFWSDRMLQRKKSPEFTSLIAQHISGNKNTDTAMSDDDINKRLPAMIALLANTPDFQTK